LPDCSTISYAAQWLEIILLRIPGHLPNYQYHLKNLGQANKAALL
jgi:hypothetical protein